MRPSFFRGKQRKISQDVSYYVMSPERSLIQLLKETKGTPEFADDIYQQIAKGNVDIRELQNLCKKHCSQNTQILVNNFLMECSKK